MSPILSNIDSKIERRSVRFASQVDQIPANAQNQNTNQNYNQINDNHIVQSETRGSIIDIENTHGFAGLNLNEQKQKNRIVVSVFFCL